MEVSSPEVNRRLSVAPVGRHGEGEAEAEVARVTQTQLWLGTCMDAHTLYLHTHTAMETPIWIHGRNKAVSGPHIWLLWGLHEWAATEGETGILETAPTQQDGA